MPTCFEKVIDNKRLEAKTIYNSWFFRESKKLNIGYIILLLSLQKKNMEKKKTLKVNSKEAIKKMVEEKLFSLLQSLETGTGSKKMRKTAKRAGKILVKGIKSKKVEKKDTIASVTAAV